MKKWTMALCAGIMLFATASTAEAKPNNPNKQHQKAWIAQHKAQKQQEKMQREQYKTVRKQQKEYEKQQRKANGVDDDYGYRNYPQYPDQQNRRVEDRPGAGRTNEGSGTWGLGDILGGIGL